MKISGFLITLVALSASACALQGCAAVQLYNLTTAEKKVEISIDPAGEAKLKKQFTGTSHIAVWALSTVGLGFSDIYEKQPGKRITVVTDRGDPLTVSMSQAKDVLASLCKSGVDASTFLRFGVSDTNRVSYLIGRADTATNGDWYVYNCRAKTLESSPLTIKFNALAQGAEDANRLLGQGLAGKILSW